MRARGNTRRSGMGKAARRGVLPAALMLASALLAFAGLPAATASPAWSAPARVSTQSDYGQYYPQIALDGAGAAHVVWSGYDPDENYEQIYYATNAGGAGPPRRASPPSPTTASTIPR